MYTICWTKNGQDRWERCSTKHEVYLLLLDNNLIDDEDCLIIPPQDKEMSAAYFINNIHK